MSKVLAVCMLGALMAAPFASAETRIWTDSKGRTVDAEFMRLEAGKVYLKLADGREIPYPMDLLSAEDQAFVKEIAPPDLGEYVKKLDYLVLKKLQEVGVKPNPLTTDEQFVRRAYLDIAGRIPTYAEAVDFLESSDRKKRVKLIDQLLDSPAYVSNTFNYYSDLLRIRTQVNMAANYLKGDPYADWVKDAIRENRPFDKMVTELLTATGKIWDNPATGYLLTDVGMPLCNLSNTFTVFLGTEITCAQCHDHPFEEVYQMDFYKMASFFGETDTRGTNRDEMQSIRQEEQRLQKELKAAGKLGDNRQFDNQLRNILNSNNFYIANTGENKVRLPHDYKYDDGEPNATVAPATYFGAMVNVEEYENPRVAFANWMTSPENPRFTVNLVNRLWKRAFGLAQIEPVDNIPGHLDGQAQNYELLKFLEDMMKDFKYDVKTFMKVIYNSQAYQREASHEAPTLTQIDRGEYPFQGPVLRRMTAEQIWDSLVTLTTPDPEGLQRRGWEDYRDIMNTDLTKLDADGAWDLKERWRDIGSLGAADSGAEMMMGESMMDMSSAKIGRETMVRASELTLPARPGHFLRMFGQSDKQLIENSWRGGSVPQVMSLMNGEITNSVLTSENSAVMQAAAAERGRGDRVDKLFLSILTRYPTSDERSRAYSAARSGGGRDDDEGKSEPGYADVIWALVNTREFLFIQ